MDWLRKGRTLDDSTILRHIILDSMESEVERVFSQLRRKKSKRHIAQSLRDWLTNQQLDIDLFEYHYGLTALPKSKLPLSAVNDALDYHTVHEEIPGREAPLVPNGNSPLDQMDALLPKCVTSPKFQSVAGKGKAKDKTSSYAYTLARISDGWTPDPRNWQTMPIGLDRLNAALFTIHMVSNVIETRIPWLAIIWKYETERYRHELLKGLLRDLTLDVTVGETIDLLGEFQKKLVRDLPRDPILGWLFESQEHLRAYNASNRLVECRVSKESGRPEAESKFRRTKPKHFRTKLREDIKQHIEPPAGGIETPQTPQPRSLWCQATLRPDGPIAHQFEGLLGSLRAEMNVLNHNQLVKTCEYLAEIERPGRPTALDISTATGVGRRSAHVENVELALVERFIPSLIGIGLRQRYIFTDMHKSAVDSNGVNERMAISGDVQFQGVTSHLEPRTSEGPPEESLPEGYYQTTVDTDLISMRMDLFDREKGSWRIRQEDELLPPGRTPQWLMRETSSEGEEYKIPSQREVDILSILSAVQMNASQRRWLLGRIQFPLRTADYLLSTLLKTGILRLLYHPALEFAGLPEGMIIASSFKTDRDLDEFIEWLTGSFPYVHIQYSREENSAVSRVRVPRFTTTSAMIRGRLRKLKAERAFGTIRRNQTYHFSAFHRIYQSMHRPWLDPWTVS